MAAGHVYAFFRPEEKYEYVVATDEEPEEDTDWGDALVCAVCNSVVTWKKEKISVQGKHTYVFFNPAGIIFELGCFRIAPGCVPLSRGTLEFTWFDGYAWRICVCGHCHNHLGWRYDNLQGAGSFFGLILSQLRDKKIYG